MKPQVTPADRTERIVAQRLGTLAVAGVLVAIAMASCNHHEKKYIVRIKNCIPIDTNNQKISFSMENSTDSCDYLNLGDTLTMHNESTGLFSLQHGHDCALTIDCENRMAIIQYEIHYLNERTEEKDSIVINETMNYLLDGDDCLVRLFKTNSLGDTVASFRMVTLD
jgi:exoribonuclease R